MSRKLTTHLLSLAENDDFYTTLHILLSTQPSQINLNRRTSSGDYLITLAAFAACERSMKHKIRIEALKCLHFIIERDFTAVNKVAADGGSALHCALVAASCFDEFFERGDDCDDGDDSGDDDDSEAPSDEEYDNEDEDEREMIDKVYLLELKSRAIQESSIVDNYRIELSNLSSDEIIILTIQLLLSNEIDVNLPLANVNNLSYDQFSDNNNSYNNDDDEVFELAFSRESIIEQWTPLMLGLQMIILASKQNSQSQHRFVGLSLLILHLLLEAGADPYYMMAGTGAGTISCEEWNAFHIINSAYHCLGLRRMDPQIYDTIFSLQIKIMAFREKLEDDDDTNYTKLQGIDEYQTVYDCVNSMLANKSNNDRKLSPEQCFTAAIMKNDVHAAKLILCTSDASSSSSQLLEKWRTFQFSSMFPLLQSVWEKQKHSTMTVVDAAAFYHASDSIKLLTNDDPLSSLSQNEIMNCVKFALLNHTENENHELALTENLGRTMKVLLGKVKNENGMKSDDDCICKRQRVLDVLLIECCKQSQWAQISTMEVLIQLGADPNVKSILHNIKDSLTPLHLIAGNKRGEDGVSKAALLLGKRMKTYMILEDAKKFENADVFALTSESKRLPIQIALEKKNYQVAKHLFEVMNLNMEDTRMKWDVEQAYLLGEAAIECTSLELFQSAMDIIKLYMVGKHSQVSSRAVGKLVLLALDERSGFGKKLMANGNEELHLILSKIIQIVSEIHEEHPELILSPWIKDEVSGQTPIHHLLRSDRGSSLRKLLLRPLCLLLSRDDGKSNLSTNSVSLPCDEKFGSYTPLHLACALGCEESVKTLLEFNTDTTSVSGDKKKALEMIPDQTKFTKKTIMLMSSEL